MDITFATILWYVFYFFFGIFGICALLGTFFTVKQQQIAAVERFGQFKRIAKAGLNFKVPFIDKVVFKQTSLRVKQMEVPVETKTDDDVPLSVTIAVQYFIMPDKAYDALYKFSNPQAQIGSYVEGEIIAKVPNMELDNVFSEQHTIGAAVKEQLTEEMTVYGYGISKAQVVKINPDEAVMKAMAEKQENKRLREAAEEKGEADKILAVKAAEAEAESKRLQGEGIAQQRKAIVDGLRESVTDFTGAVPGAEPSDVMELVLMTQYFDTLKDVAASGQSKVIMVPHSPGGVADIKEQLRTSIVTGNELSSDDTDAGKAPKAAPASESE